MAPNITRPASTIVIVLIDSVLLEVRLRRPVAPLVFNYRATPGLVWKNGAFRRADRANRGAQRDQARD
ncbi:MAG TPA: hypothetical protein VFV05_07440 [Methylomirabilota bacterium]|nr:hypothetical protein [Methylomirabilota bacterium]